MPEKTKPEVAGSTKTWIGSTVTTVLGLILGVTLTIVGSFLTWNSDGVLDLFNASGWHYQNIISGDGKITFALGALMAAGLLLGLLMQSRVFYMVTAVSGLLVMFLSIYELIQISTLSGITGPGHGLYMALGGGVAGAMLGFCGYSMMRESRAAGTEVSTANSSSGVA
jgi:hypothetical protein